MIRILHDRPITVYNAEKKEVVGIFNCNSLAIRYLFNKLDSKTCHVKFTTALNRKTKITQTVFKFKVVVRFANDYQVCLLGQNEYLILNNYPFAPEQRMRGFIKNVSFQNLSSVEKRK